MPALFGRNISVGELLQKVGDISQVARVKSVRLIEGVEDGVLGFDFMTGSGLTFSVLASRGMDISAAHYKGKPLAWRSATGDAHPYTYEPEKFGWLRGFYGGLVTTCGYSTMGFPSEDDGQQLGLHGRASYTPAYHLAWGGEWRGEDYVLFAQGKLREAIVFGENLELTRRIETQLGATWLRIHDVVKNLGYKRTPHMILYHINLGFPVVDEGAEVVLPSKEVTPRTEIAAKDIGIWNRLIAPTPGFSEQVYFHKMGAKADGVVLCGIVNRACEGGYGVYVRYNRNQLPYFTQWKMMGQGEYVVGLEPGNALVQGRVEERAAGRLQYLDPGETREYILEIGVLDGAEAIARFEEEVRECSQ